MKRRNNRPDVQINSGSMADIAFLLLIFFLVTTNIVNDKGITLLLPAPPEQNPPVPFNERNLFTIRINSADKLFIENETRDTHEGLRDEIQAFILNNGKNKNLSDNPQKAVVSIKTNRGTTQRAFIKILDEVKAAYYQIYADNVDITPDEFRALASSDPLYVEGKKGYPMNISIAEPNK
ncbi:MAG: biopolymer transporter ExbD [Bacteroidota bacterium]